MTHTRRVPTVIGLPVAITADGTLPAAATFSESGRRTRRSTGPGLAYQPRVSIMTLTSYAGTAESAKTPVLAC